LNDNLDKYTEEELVNYFCKILGFEQYEENPRDKETKNFMITAKLAARDLKEGKFLAEPPLESHEAINMGSLVRKNHRTVEPMVEISYNNSNITVYKTIAYSTVGDSDNQYDYMEFLDLVKKQ
jgi:flagella basal body P-ring formation protein FlgA